MVSPLVQNCITDLKQRTISVMRGPAPIRPSFKFNETEPKGNLLNDTLSGYCGSTFRSYFNSARDFYRALKGEGNDYTVGRLNDSAIRLGSLGIAGVLSAALTNKVAKGMEFAGFACWFAAMSIWPSVFINLPLKKLTGVNFMQEYKDSYGRTKRFFEDPQYLCWDLFDDKKINEIGDKLKIPKNIENRRAHLQDKMKQIAIQANTLWMLTAGFATPIFASLMAHPIERFLYWREGKKKAVDESKRLGNLSEDVLSQHILDKQKTLKTDLENRYEDLKKFIDGQKGSLDQKGLDEVRKRFKDAFAERGLYYGGIEKQLEKILKQNPEFGLEEKLTASIQRLFEKEIGKLEGSEKKIKGIKTSLRNIFRGFKGNCDSQGFARLQDKLTVLFDKEIGNSETINDFVDELSKFFASSEKVSRSSKLKNRKTTLKRGIIRLFEAAKESSVKAVGFWEKNMATLANLVDSKVAMMYQKLPSQIINILGIDENLKNTLASNPSDSSKLITEHLKTLADSPEREKVLNKLVEYTVNFIDPQEAAAEKLYRQLRETGLSAEMSKLLPSLGYAEKDMARVLEEGIQDRLMDTKSTFYKLIKFFDVLSQKKLIDEKLGNIGKRDRKIIEEKFNILLEMLISHDRIDNTTNRFEEYRNRLIKIGRVSVKTRDKLAELGLSEKYLETNGMNDLKQFEDWMDKIYGKLSKETKAVLNKSKLRGKRELAGDIAQHFDKLKKGLIGTFHETEKAMSKQEIFEAKNNTVPFARLAKWVGKSIKSLVVDAAKEVQAHEKGMYEAASKNRWLLRLGIAGAVLTGITWIAISRFGRTNQYNSDIYKVKGDTNAG